MNLRKISQSLFISLINLLGPVLLLLVMIKCLDKSVFSENFKNYYNILFLSTFISLQAQSTMLRRNTNKFLSNNIIYFLRRSMHNFLYGSTIACIIYIVFKNVIFESTSIYEFIFCVVASYFFQLFQGLLNIFIRLKDFKKQILLSLYFYLTQLFIIFTFSIIFETSTLIRTSALIFSSIIVVIIFYFSKIKYDKSYVSNEKKLKSYEVWLIPHVLSSFLLGHFDKIVITNKYSTISGDYIILSQIIGLLVIIPTSINRIIVPIIFNGDFNRKLYSKKKVSFFIFFIFIVYFLFGLLVYSINNFFLLFNLDKSTLIIFVLVLNQFLNMIYLVSVTFIHEYYDSKKISILTCFTAFIYVIYFILNQNIEIYQMLVLVFILQTFKIFFILYDIKKNKE